ncbi:MAG: hypothetical protein ACTTKL_00740, partial [Treponema sp.]
ANSKQQTANSKQQTANSKQQTALSAIRIFGAQNISFQNNNTYFFLNLKAWKRIYSVSEPFSIVRLSAVRFTVTAANGQTQLCQVLPCGKLNIF